MSSNNHLVLSNNDCDLLYECALKVEQDSILNNEMDDWSCTIADGLDCDNTVLNNPNDLNELPTCAELNIKLCFWKNGNKRSERYYLNNKPHRDDGPAYTFYYEDGSIRRISFFNNGKRHREDGPSEVHYNREGYVIFKCYLKNGICDSIDEPSVFEYHDNGNIKQEVFYLKNKIHRDNGPAVISYDENGEYESEVYYLNSYVDTMANDNGPSAISYYNGVKTQECYHIPCPSLEKSVLSRVNGPAVIEYDDSENIDKEMYYINGKLHREDGPAIVYSKNPNNATYGYYDKYYFNDEFISVKSLEEYLKYVESRKLLEYFSS